MKSWMAAGMILIVLAGALAIGVGGGILLDRQVLLAYAPPSGIPPNAQKDFQLIAQAWNVVEAKYVDRTALQSTTLTYGAISGLVDSLGDTGHSRFLSPEMVKQNQQYESGQFTGIGVEVQVVNGQIVIVAPIDGSPAQKAGLRSGDIILKVDGTPVTDLPLDQVAALIQGPVGTSVTLTIQQANSTQTKDVTVMRAVINVARVTWAQSPGTDLAHIRISGFSNGVTSDLKTALDQAQSQGLKGVILDLRNNPGGLLSEAVGTASQFLTKGNVLLTKDSSGNEQGDPVQPGGVAPNIPLVVLVNGGTASASEVVAGAIQDDHRGLLVGEQTFGTGTVLESFSLSDGSAILLATQEWLTPDGRVIWHKGLTPDVVVALPADASQLLPEAEKSLTPAQLEQSGDTQLLRAIQLLTTSTSGQR